MLCIKWRQIIASIRTFDITMLSLIKPQQFLRKTSQSLHHCLCLSRVMFLCNWRIKVTYLKMKKICIKDNKFPSQNVHGIYLLQYTINCIKLLNGDNMFWNIKSFIFKTLLRSLTIDWKQELQLVSLVCVYRIYGTQILVISKQLTPTHILTASTQIAANIKVIVIEVAKVIKTNFSCSPETNKEQNSTMVSWDVCG